MKANVYYVNRQLHTELPVGVEESKPAVEPGGEPARLGQFITWLPAILLTDDRVKWEEIDGDAALVTVPFGEKRDSLIVRLDQTTGKVQYLWFDDLQVWANWVVEDTAYNAQVDTSL